MNQAAIPLYLASEECDRPELPVAFEIERYLSVEGIRGKAAVIKTARPIYRQGWSAFVVLAKGHDVVRNAEAGGLIGVYLLPLDSRAGLSDLDLSQGLQPVQDWCAITTSRERAESWQVRA